MHIKDYTEMLITFFGTGLQIFWTSGGKNGSIYAMMESFLLVENFLGRGRTFKTSGGRREIFK